MNDYSNQTANTPENVNKAESYSKDTIVVKKNKKNKWIALIALVLVYTLIVSVVTVKIDRAYIQHKMDKAIEEAFDIDDSENKETTDKEEKKSIPVKLNEKFMVENMFEITILKSEWDDKEVLPSKADLSNGGYSYYEDKDGETYFVVRAKVKNISTKEIDLSFMNAKCSLLVNEKYNLNGNIGVEDSDGTGFYGSIKPLQESNVVFYVSVSDEMYKTCELAKMTIGFVNNETSIDSYVDDESIYNYYSISFTK